MKTRGEKREKRGRFPSSLSHGHILRKGEKVKRGRDKRKGGHVMCMCQVVASSA
jgi:hypothetical protein